jgi:glycerophosphoryl diester phosphodiesterase
MKRLWSMGLSALMLATSIINAHAVEIIAHRGASHDAPENTVSAFRLGWEQQADGVDLDIYLSKDGQVVVMHDKTTKRTAGLDKKLVAQNLEELRRLDAGSWKSPAFAGEKIPTLDEAIATMPADENRRLVIEIKCGPEVLPALKTTLERSGKPVKQFLIIGFSHDTMKAAKQALPQYEMYWLSEFKAVNGTKPTIEELIRDAKAIGVEGLNLKGKELLGTDYIQKVKAAGLKCYTWTVDSPVDAKQLAVNGIDGITTNRPLWLRQQLAASGK